jgi:alkylated DNA repair protein (DNA oxidative demethylase)
MGAHRDADERDFSQPIVSVTLGAPATFLWYGARRAGSPLRIRLVPGDVLVWGGEARRGYHAVGPPEAPPGAAGTAGAQAGLWDAPGAAAPVRINLTFRKAG